MRKQKLKKLLKSVVKSHGDVDDDKKEIENNVEKMLELFENNSADVSYGSDLVSIVNDIKKRCHSLYERHDGLTNLIKSKAWHRNRESSSGSSDSGSESSSDEDKPNNNHGQEVEQQISLEEYKSVLEKLNVISERNAELEAQNNAMHAKLEENEYLANEVAERQTVLTKLENELQTLRESFKLLQAEKELLKSDIERSKDREGSLGLSLKALQDENELLMIEKQNNSRMLLENEEALKKLKNDLEMIVEEADKVRNENVCLREELEKTAQEVVILNQQLAVTCDEKESSRTVAENLKLESVNLTSENARLHLENRDCNARLEASAMRVFHLNDRLLIAEEENNNLKTEVLSLSTHMKEAEKTIDDVSMQSGLMKEEICILQNKIDELNHQLKVKDDKKLEIERRSSEACKMLQLAQEKCLLLSAEMETMKNENLLLLTRNDNLNQVLECNNEELSNLGQALKATEFERDTLTEEKFALLGKINEGVAIHVELKAQIEQVEGEKSQLMLKIDDLGLQLQAANLQLSDVNNAVLTAEEEKRTLLTENSVVKAKLQEAELRIESFQTQFGVLNEQNSILQSKVQEAEKDANDLKFERDGVIADNKKLENKVEELKLKIHDLDLQLHAANLQLSDMNNAALAAEEEKRALLAENSIVKSKLQEIEVSIDNFQTQFRVLNEQNSILQSKVEEAEKDKNDLKFERDGVIADNKKLENKVEELKLKIHDLDLQLHASNLQLSDVKNAIVANEEEKRALLAENSIVKSKLQEVELRIDNFQIQFGVLNEQNLLLQGKVEEAEKDTNDFKIERDAVIGDNKQLYIKVKELQTELETTNVRLHDLEKLISSAKEQKENMVSEISVLTGKITHAQLDNLTLEKERDLLREENTAFQRVRNELHNKMIDYEKRLEEGMAEMQHLKDTLKLHQAEVLHEVQLMTDTLKGDLVEVAMQKDDLDQKIGKLTHLSSENEASLKKLEDALRSKISEQEALVEKYEDLLNKHKQLEDSYYEAVEKLNIAEKKLEEMFAKDQIIQKFETVSADQKNEMYKLSESYKEILEKLLLTEVAKTDIDKEMQRLEVQLRLSNQKLKITETEYKEKEDGFKKLVEGLQEELRLLDRQVLKWSGDFRVLNSGYMQTRLALDNGLGISFNELQKLRSASVEDMKYAKLQLAECLSELQEVKARLESVFHQKIKLQNETRQQELRLRYQQNVIFDLKDEASRKGMELAEKSRQLHILERRVIETETKLREKEKEVLDKDEEKREAIRQLCLLIEYHWENSNHLVKYLSSVQRRP